MMKWENDLLNREEESSFLISYLTNRYMKEKNKTLENKSFVLNINASWGSGKTYFLKNLALELKSKNYTVVEFDAWKNDYTKEPLLAFMSELNNSLESFFSPKQKKAKSFLKNLRNNSLPILMSILSRKLTGYTLDELVDEAEENEQKNQQISTNDDNKEITDSISSLTTKLTEYALEEHNTIKKSIEEFKKSMIKLLKYLESLKNKELPLFILIDELDRCRPNYAIELLENIKHLFDIKGLYFIIATDSKQLSHSINAIYGLNFESEKYLKRFFDQEYKLKEPNTYEYIFNLFNTYDLLDDEIIFSPLEETYYKNVNTKVKMFEFFVQLFSLKPRDINQIVISLSAIRITWSSQDKIHLVYILFLLILKHLNNSEYQSFVNSSIKDERKVVELIHKFNDNNVKIKIDSFLFHDRWSSYSVNPNKEIQLIELIQIYVKFFNMTYDNFNKSHSSSMVSIYNNIYKIIEKEIRSYGSNEKIDLSIFKYHKLVEHTGQLS